MILYDANTGASKADQVKFVPDNNEIIADLDTATTVQDAIETIDEAVWGKTDIDSELAGASNENAKQDLLQSHIAAANAYVREITLAEYNAIKAAGQVDDNQAYHITDGIGQVGFNADALPLMMSMTENGVVIENVGAAIRVLDERTVQISAKSISGKTIIFESNDYIGTSGYMLEPYCSDGTVSIKTQTIDNINHTFTVICNKNIATGAEAICIATKKGV